MTEAEATLRVRIDSLVLDGIPSDAVEHVARAFRERLARLLAAESQIDSASHIDAGAIELDPTDTSEAIGSRLASVVYGGLTSGARE
jgi:hypothetical protein